MKTNEDVRHAHGRCGKGGIKCYCCGKSSAVDVQKEMRIVRRFLNRRAIEEGIEEMEEMKEDN